MLPIIHCFISPCMTACVLENFGVFCLKEGDFVKGISQRYNYAILYITIYLH